jgi:hypothetical protein
LPAAAGSSQKAGVIRYEQGRVRIVDRPGMTNATRKCHRFVKQKFQRALGKPVPRWGAISHCLERRLPRTQPDRIAHLDM